MRLALRLALGAAVLVAFSGPAVSGEIVGPTDAANWWRGYENAPIVPLESRRGLHLYCMGSGSPTVIMEAGQGNGAWTWRFVQPAISRLTRTCSYDRAGYGSSDAGPLPRDLDRLTADLAQLLSTAKIQGPYILVGHSLGGQIVRQFAYLYPKKVAGLVLVDPAADHVFEAYDRIDPGFIAEQRESEQPSLRCAHLAEKGMVSPSNLAGAQCMAPPPSDMPADLWRFHFAYLQSPVHEYAAIAELEAGLNGTDGKEADAARRNLGSMPIVVLTADANLDNPNLPPAERRKAGAMWLHWHEEMAHLSSGGEEHVVRATSHSIQQDQPDAVIAAIRKVVAEVRASPGA